MDKITFEGEENINALAVLLTVGVAAMEAIKADNDPIQSAFSDEVLKQIKTSGNQLDEIVGIGDSSSIFFMKRALASMAENLDKPKVPVKSRWQERLEQVQAAHKEAQYRRDKASGINKKYNFDK